MLWRIVAWIVSRRPVWLWLVARAQRTPYTHLGPVENRYMMRYWLFNPYGKDANGEQTPPRWPLLCSIRLHWILRPDADRHKHNHPWRRARTCVMSGWYREERYLRKSESVPMRAADLMRDPEGHWCRIHTRDEGYTGELLHDDYHRIREVSLGGVWTLFITWGGSLGWSFRVRGVDVPWREYLKSEADV